MSLHDEAMKLKDGKIIYDQLASMVAVQYSEAESNPAGSYVIYNGSVYLLPNGHIANTSWANTEKEGPTNIGAEHRALKTEINSAESAVEILKKSNVKVDSLFGVATAENVSVVGGSGSNVVAVLNTRADAVYYIHLELASAVDKTVYYAFTKPDGTVVGYSNSIEAGNTEGIKVVKPTEDYIGARVVVSCASDFVVKKLTIVSNSNTINDISGSMVGDSITEIPFTSTNKKSINSNGVVSDSSDTTYYVSEKIEIEGNKWYQIMASAGYSECFYVIYDKNNKIIDFMRAPGGSARPLVNRVIYSPVDAKYIQIANISNVCAGKIAVCNTLKPKTTKKPEWMDKFLTISYSSLNVAATNSLETYISAGHFGFNVCKGDVRPTSDGKLIMCHDPGFTFDGNGRITTYNSSNKTLIHDMTHAQCMEKEYAERATASENNHYQKVADIDGFLDVCKQYGMIAFITVRDEYIDTVASAVMSALKRHNMTERAIINGYEPMTNSLFRFVDDNIPLSFVQSDNFALTEARVNRIQPFGNAIVTLVSNASSMRTYLEGIENIINYARNNGVYVMYAQPQTLEDVYWLRDFGISGAQIGNPCLPYQMEQVKFKVKLLSGVPSIVEYKDIPTMDAVISASGNVVSVSEFTIPGSTRGFPDLIMEYWMNQFAKRITAESENGNAVSAKWQNNAVKLTVGNISTDDIIDVIVEV